MTRTNRTAARRGATLLETAVVLPVVFLLLIGMVVGGMGVYRYQHVAHLAREGARYASTHGGDYYWKGTAQATGVPAISDSAGLTAYLRTRYAALDPNRVTVTVSYTAGNSNQPLVTDTNPNLVPPGQIAVPNYVRVTVSYRWTPEAYLSGPITLTSTSHMPVSY